MIQIPQMISGAIAMVGNNVEPYTIVVGNPAKPLRKRFDDELIDLLLTFKWLGQEYRRDKRIDPASDLQRNG